MSSQIYGVGPLDPMVIGAVIGVFGVVALCACILPARSAMRVDPVIGADGAIEVDTGTDLLKLS